MKNFNLIEMLRGCSKRNGMAVSASNPDGEPTVNRQSRLMSHRGYLKNLAMIFAVLVMSVANVGTAWGASVAEGTYNFVDQTISAKNEFYKIDNGIYQYRLNGYSKNSSLGIQLPSGTGDGTGFAFHLESTQKVYIGIVKKSVKREVTNNLYIKTITEANFSAIEAGSNSSTTVTLTLGGSATLSGDYTFAAIGSAKTEGATVYMGELPAGYYYAYGNSSNGEGYLYSISFGTQTLFLVPNDKTASSAKFAIYYWMGASGYERQGWSDYMTVSPCNSSTYRADIPKGYTNVIFVRLNPSGGRNWDSKWNQTGNLTFDGSKDLFTWANGSWDGATTTWSASTKYTISFASNGGSGSMSNVSSIACGRSVTLAANAYEKSGYVFAGWKTNVAVTANGEAIAANGIVADGATISNITSNITLTAQWNEDVTCTATQPGALSKGTLSGCSRTITASGSAASNNIWYWQSSASGTDKSDAYSSGKAITEAGTYYLRSFCSDGSGCWSDAVQVTITAADMTPAAPTALAKSSVTAKGVTLTVTDAANTNDYEFYVNTSSSAPSSGTSASYTSTSKSVTITDKYAGTTFYAWARAKCGSNKSAWTALGDGGTFTTSTVTVTHTLTNVTKTSGATTAGGSDYTAEFAAVSGYSMPTPTVTIDGNTATSGTDYTWTAGTGTISIPANKINGNIVITLNSVPSAPSSATISGTYHYFPGENISLTVTPTGNNGPTTYQWYKGGKADGNRIDGATSATYTKNSCAFEDAGSYYCQVTCNATSIWAESGNSYDVKILRLYVKGSKNGEDYGNVDFVKVDGTTATASISLGSNWTYGFNIADGCGHYYGNAGTMQYNNYGPWTTNLDGTDCGLTTTNAATYIFTINYSSLSSITTTVTFPVANQAAGKVIYFDNNVLKWTGSSIYYRIGHSSHSQADQLSLVPGTANLYKMTTREYNGFSAWQIGNAEGGNGSDKSIYNTKNTPAITASIAYEGGAVTADAITITPTLSHATGTSSDNNNCEFYEYGQQNGMKRDRVTISGTSNGTVTVNYTSEENVASSFSATTVDVNQDLAHTVIITPTATPATGYNLGSLTVNEVAHTSGNTYTVTANTTIAATFTAKTYNITLDRNGASSGSESVTMTYNSSSHTAITAPVKAGYTFDGWYDSETNNNGSGNLVMNASGVLQANVTGFTGAGGIWTKDATGTLYAKWTAAASQTALVANTLYEVPDMIPSGESLTSSDQFLAGLSANTKFEMIGVPASSSTPKVNNDTKNDKTIDGITFDDGSMWFKGEASLTSNIPTTFGLSFIIPEGGGKLYLYFSDSGTSTNIKLAKSGSEGSKPTLTDGYAAVDVTAGTYYLYGTGTTSPYSFYGLKLCSKYNVSISTTSVTKTDGATGVGAAIHGRAYTATFTAPVGYTLPSDVTSLTIGGVAQTKGTGYTWTISDGTATLTIPAAKVTGNIVVSVAGAAASTYSITYHCNGAESGCPSNVAATTNLPSPLPTGLTKDGYDFGGWFTDSECTEAAVAGAALTGNADLYAKWTERGSECEDTPHAWDVIATSAKSYKVRISKVTEEVAIPVADATASNLTAYAGSVSTNDNVTVQIADGGSSKYGYKFDGSNTYLKLVFSTPLVLNDTLVVGMTNASHNISFTTTAVRSTTLSTSGGKLIIPAALAGQSTIYLWRGSGSTMYLRSFAVKHECEAIPSCTTPVIPALSNQTVCEGSDIAAWNATPTNASAITAAGQSIAYSWKKKGNDTELENNATFDLGASATESQAGTYVVTVTVSKAGYASASASKEVDLTVTEGTEAPTVTQSTTPVYEGNSVTLTATATTGATYTWHTCNADGTGESSAISGATTNAYTIASAPAAGTHYYKVKVTGDGTHTCGNAETVYALTVSEAAGGDCETEFWFAKAADKPEGATAATHISGTPSGSSSASYTATIDGNNYTITGQTGQKTGNVTITVPEDYEGTLYVVVQGSSSRTITLSKGGVQVGQETPANSTWGTFTFSNLDAGTYTLVSSGNIGWGILALKLCSASACYDPEVTASVNNTTACAGTSVTFTATGAHAEATYQWQKLDGTWTDISGADASTYNIPSVVAGDAGKYRVIASHACNRTSNEVTLSVPSAPNFGSTVPTSVSVMQTIALSINTVEATDAVKYRWYKSADATWDAGDVEIGTNKELIKAYDSEAIGSPSYYIFCRAQNACGITTSTAIEVNVTAYVEEDCATRGNEGDAEFGFEYSAGQATYSSTACWSMNDNSKKLIYTAPEGKYFKTMKVTIASSSASKASYNWSTNGGTTFTEVAINSINTTLTEKTIDVSAHGNVNTLQIGRNLGGNGESSGTLYVSKICFEYTDACTATTVTPSTASVNYEMGGEWSNPTFTLSPVAVSGETLTYSSSNEDIASVDDDGTVTFNGDAGTVTITASYAGGTISATEYCASQGSYTITVSCSGGAPKVVAAGSTDMENCNSSVTLHAKKQDGTAFADGTYQWFRNGEEIDGETSSSYTATQAGTYTVERTNGTGCTTPSTNSAIVTSETTEPEVERLVPFQYYHVDKTYSYQMKMRHLFAVKNSGKLDGKSFKMYVSRNGGVATDVTSSNALVVWPSADGHVDTVMVDLNKLSGKYSEDDELVFTCKAINCESNVSEVYKNTITMNVIGATPTLALICSGSSKAGGTRKTGELTVGGDFLTGYNVADLCQQTGNTSFDANTEWGLYTDLKAHYIVTPVNGYAVFNKLNYEPFDILLLTDYPKASKSDAAKDVLDDMAALCDYRPMLSFKTHMVAKSPSKWAAKGFTTSATENKADGRLNLNIVCYAHPMFEGLKSGEDVYTDVGNTSAPLVYTMLTGTGYESSKGMQGFELAAAENFVTIGLTHYNGTIAKNSPDPGEVEWTPGSKDRMLVTVAERQANPEARFILFSLNCGAQSKLTDKGEEVVLACLNYLLGTAEGTIEPADCSFTFDNGASNEHDAAWYASNCPLCTGTKGDGKWTTAANWGPDYRLLPGEFTSVRIKKPVEVNDEHAHVMEVRIINEGSIDIPAGKALDVKSTIRRMEDSEIYPTEENDIHIGSASTGNGTLIFNNNSGDTKARVDMYSNAQADMENMSAATSTWQYIGTPHNDVASATRNYYNSWLYQYSGSGWEVIPNGGPLVPFRGYCVTHPDAPVVFDMEGTLVATTAQDIAIPAGYTVIANSWTAPIDINAITDDDMENISDKTIYFFNTGSDADGNHGTGTAAGTYRATPIHSASYTGDWQIPSMQGFYISTTSAGTLHLDYDRHVRPTGSRSVVSNPMYAPRRAAAESDEPNVLKIFARGSRYQDKLIVLEREDFTRGYDSGWDGEAWGGSNLSPMVYVIGEGREDAVSAIPEYEGTVVAFKAGEDSEYRFEFIYDGDESLYLFDTENNTYTQIMTGNAYYFTTTDKAAHSRFILTRKAPQIATGVGEVPSDQVLSTKAKKLLIEDKMYILLNGMLYDATGKVVFK